MSNIGKKIGLVLATFFVLVLAAIVIVPLVVDVDKYRPQIVDAANQKINGKLEIGKLKLSLWGQIRVQVQGMTLTGPDQKPVVEVKDAYFHFPFASLISGSPEMIFKMQHPVVNVYKNKQGQLNVMKLMKETPVEKTAQAQQPQATQPPSGGAQTVTLPAIATRARLGVEFRDADLSYKDEVTDLVSNVKNLNLVMRDISLSRPTLIELWADLDTRMGKSIVVKGPARLDGKVEPTLKDNRFDHVQVTAKANLDDLEINVVGSDPKGAGEPLFQKKKGMAANADVAMTASESEAKIDRMDAKFFNAELKSHGVVTMRPNSSPVIQYEMKTNNIDLKSWNQLVPMLKEFELSGHAQMDAEANGPSDKLNYRALLKVEALTAKAPKLKQQPRFDGTVKVSTDQLEEVLLTMQAPGNDLKVKGKLVSFTAPRADFEVTSNSLDLDQLVELPPPGAKKEATPAAKTADAGATKTGEKTAPATGGAPAHPTEDYDAMLAPLRENKIARDTVANLGVNLKLIKVYGVRMTDTVGKMTLRDLVMGVDGFGMKVFGGAVRANMAMDFKPAQPTYRFSTGVEGLMIQQAVESQFQLLKNTLFGKAYFDMSGDGASFNPDPAKMNLKAKGKLKVEDATFATIDVMKMASEAINKAIDRIGEKIPAVKNRKINVGSGASEYEYVSSDFTIAGGKFTAPNFMTKAKPNKGIDLKGDTTVGLKDMSLKTSWEVIDTYNLTKARDISVEIAGAKVEHLLAEGNNPVKFPVSAGCTVTAPCYSYTEVPEYLAKVALKNSSGAATGKARAEVQKRAEELIQKNAPPAVQDKLKDLGKKFFGR